MSAAHKKRAVNKAALRAREQKLKELVRVTADKSEQLRLAADVGDAALVERLLDEGVNPNNADDKKRYALHFAACNGHHDVVTLLVQHGANVNVQDLNNNTPLHLAVISNHINVIARLLHGGADMRATDVNKRTPADAARSRLQFLRLRGVTNDALDAEVSTILSMLLSYSMRSERKEAAELLQQLQDQFGDIQFTGSKLDALESALSSLSL